MKQAAGVAIRSVRVSGWKIFLDRGLDVFQRADLNNGFSPAGRHQRFRQVKAFEVTYLREGLDVSS